MAGVGEAVPYDSAVAVDFGTDGAVMVRTIRGKSRGQPQSLARMRKQWLGNRSLFRAKSREATARAAKERDRQLRLTICPDRKAASEGRPARFGAGGGAYRGGGPQNGGDHTRY
jgi:hypothetical protein